MDKTTTKMKMMRQKLTEFAGYTTLHGVNRMLSNQRVIGKVLWCAVILVCLGFCTRQIYMLCDQYARNTLITMVSIRQHTVRFPDISLCNLNPVSFYRIQPDFLSGKSYYKLGSILFHIYERSFRSGIFEPTETQVYIGFTRDFQTIVNSDRQFRQGMSSLNVTPQEMKNFHPDIGDFVISCIVEGQPCKPSSFVPFFDKHYGLCYRFSSGSKLSKTSGPLFALQLIIDVNQSDYLPNTIANAGIILSINEAGTNPLLQNNGMLIATGVQTDISLLQKTVERFPDRTLCDESIRFNGVQDCFEHCKLEYVKRMCDCLGVLVHRYSGQRICYNYDVACVANAIPNLTNCSCLSPCRETKYEKTVTTSRWPARKFEPFLEKLYRKRGLNYSDYKDSLLAVNIYLESLSEEVVKEEPAFTRENLMSNIGGALGLWIGMSIISIGEILELTWMLCSTVLKRHRINTTVPQSSGTTVAKSDTTTGAQSQNKKVAQPDNTAVDQSDNTVVV